MFSQLNASGETSLPPSRHFAHGGHSLCESVCSTVSRSLLNLPVWANPVDSLPRRAVASFFLVGGEDAENGGSPDARAVWGIASPRTTRRVRRAIHSVFSCSGRVEPISVGPVLDFWAPTTVEGERTRNDYKCRHVSFEFEPWFSLAPSRKSGPTKALSCVIEFRNVRLGIVFERWFCCPLPNHELAAFVAN